jgi:MFS family permease
LHSNRYRFHLDTAHHPKKNQPFPKAPSPERIMKKRAYATIIAGFFTVSIAYAIRYGYGMLLPEMLPALGIGKAQAGMIFAAYFVVYTAAAPVLGAISDRYNYRVILILFTLILAGGASLMALAESLWQACLFFAITGLGHAACWAPVTALVQKWVPDRKRGMALSLVTIGVGLGIPLWGFLLPLIVAAAGWRAGWLGMGMFSLAVSILNAILVRNPLPEDDRGRPVKQNTASFGHTARDLFNTPVFWIIGTAYLFVGFNALVPFTFLPLYAREFLGLPYTSATRLVAIMALCGVGGQLTLGPISDGVGRVRVMKICGLIMGLGCLGMMLAHQPWTLYLCTAFYGIGYGAVWSVYGAAASDFFSKTQTGGIVGLWTVFLGVGSILSPMVCGWTIDATGSYAWALLLGLGSGVLSAVVLLLVPGRVR